MLLKTLIRKLIKGREIEAADTPFNIAQLNAFEMADHVTGFGASSTLTQTIKEKKLSPLQVFELERNFVQC